jgi:hypothetical protein
MEGEPAGCYLPAIPHVIENSVLGIARIGESVPSIAKLIIKG